MAKDKQVQSSTHPLLHYSRRKVPIVQPMQIHELEPTPGNKVITHTERSQEIVSDFHEDNEPNLPIALRKGTKKCTQRPLYPLSHFMSYEKLSHNHKTFLTHLNTIAIPKTVSEALSHVEWRNAIKVEMEALEKNKTWELVELPKEKSLVGCK